MHAEEGEEERERDGERSQQGGAGAADIAIDPSNPNKLYASTWQRIRRKWNDPRNESRAVRERAFGTS